jgi:hypothetical protein
MSLLRDIQTAASSSKGSTADLLRKCKVLAARLKSPDLSSWVEKELNGYGKDDALPDYRMINHVESRGHFVGSFGRQVQNAPIPPSCLPENLREFVETQPLYDGVSVYEALLNSKEGTFEVMWPSDLLRVVGQRIYEDMVCVTASKVIPRGAIISLVDTVRNKVLAFALDIEIENPNAGEATPSETPIPPNTVSQVFHSHFYAQVGNVASGSTNVSQIATINIAAGDTLALRAQLLQLGVPASDIDDLTNALTQDVAAGEKGLGARAAAWLGKGLSKAASGAWSVSLNAASAVVPKLIAQYLGLPTS